MALKTKRPNAFCLASASRSASEERSDRAAQTTILGQTTSTYDDLQCGRIGGLDVSVFPPVLTVEFLLNKTGSVEDMEPGAVLQQFPLIMTGLRGPFAWAPEWHAMRAVTRAFLLDFSFERGGAAERMLRGREWSLDSLGQHMPMPGAAGRKCLRQLLSMEPLAATPEEIKEWRATGHGGRHFLVTAARAFEASEEVGDAIFASARCCLVAALRVLCASVDWSRDLMREPDGGGLLALIALHRLGPYSGRLELASALANRADGSSCDGHVL
ncbi:hypothetical protein T492DRAFT_897855 [Pavlovales sp. CCMP2436]|nr:hypothetical protein T492DRAFT_897855 [Pavlovales sp. CCMP2436]